MVINSETITLKFYQITGAKELNEYNGKTYEYAPDEDNTTLSREILDTLVIRKSERS